MEQNTPTTNLFDLHVDVQSSAYLAETSKWAKFLAILGFIFCGLIILVAIFAGSILSSMVSRYGGDTMPGFGGAFISIIYILVALLYFFPCLYLFRFATKMQVALKNNDQEILVGSFKNLKSCFRFVGILTIVVLSLYVLFLIFVIIGLATVSRV